jgi:hypothetical protein
LQSLGHQQQQQPQQHRKVWGTHRVVSQAPRTRIQVCV